MPQLTATLAAIATCALLAGCAASSPAHKATAAVASAAPAPTLPAGCQQASLVAGAVSSDIQSGAPDTKGDLRQLSALAKDLSGQLGVDVAQAAYDLSLFRAKVVFGQSAVGTAKKFLRDLAKVTSECSPGSE